MKATTTTADEATNLKSISGCTRPKKQPSRIKATVHGRCVSVERFDNGNLMIKIQSRSCTRRYWKSKRISEDLELFDKENENESKQSEPLPIQPVVAVSSVSTENSNDDNPKAADAADQADQENEKHPQAYRHLIRFCLRAPVSKAPASVPGAQSQSIWVAALRAQNPATNFPANETELSISSRQQRLQDDFVRKVDHHYIERNAEHIEPDLWQTQIANSSTDKLRKPNMTKSNSKAYFWSELIGELNAKAASSLTPDLNLKNVQKLEKLERLERVPGISSDAIVDTFNYSISECPFGHRRLVGSNLLNKEAINCRHCRYAVALHEQRNRALVRRLIHDTGRVGRQTTDIQLPEIRENILSKSLDSNAAVKLWSSKGGNAQTQANKTVPKAQIERKKPETLQRPLDASIISSNATSSSMFGNTPATAPAMAATVAENLPRVTVVRLPHNAGQQEAKSNPLLSQVQPPPKPAKVPARPIEFPQSKSTVGTTATSTTNANASGNTSISLGDKSTTHGDRKAATRDHNECGEFARKIPPFYSVFANPFESGLPATVKERLNELQRLEASTIRKEREEENRKRMKRSRKHRSHQDEAADDS